MVNLGRPSRGCDVCRQRRIKCDEGSPSCSYCSKRNIICPGPKPQFDVAWRDQNLVAEKSVQRRKKAIGNTNPNKTATTVTKPPHSLVYIGLNENFVDYAVNFFLSSYIVLPNQKEMHRGFLDCLYPIWAEARPTSPVRIAVSCVAYFLLEAWSQLDDNGSAVSTALYQNGIATLRQTINNTGEVDNDVLMAALMLQMYENLRAFKSSQFSGDVHVSGANALIRQQRRPFGDETSQRLLLGTRNQFVGRALRGVKAIPPTVTSWDGLIHDAFKRPAHRLDEINIEVANFQAVVSTLGSVAIQSDLIPSLLNTAMQLDRRLTQWLTTVPSWIPIRVSGPECLPQSIRDAGMYQDHCDIFSTVFIADQINSQRCSRIRIHLSIISCLELFKPLGRDTRSTTSHTIVQGLADDVCACIPFYLGNRMDFTRLDDKTVQYPHLAGIRVPNNHHTEAAAFAGWFLTGRLAELLSPKLVLREGQKAWIGPQLGRLKRLYRIQG